MTLRLNGSTSGYVEIDAPATAGSNTLVLPTGNGSANQILKNGGTAGSLAFGTATEDSSGNFAFNSGYGSAATAYGCRAWVNFNGTGTVAIRASGNVSSITDNAVGDYTVNFTTAMPDANYMAVGLAREVPGSTAGTFGLRNGDTKSTVALQVYCYDGPIAFGDARDSSDVNVAIFR